jgi:hypothetical protein
MTIEIKIRKPCVACEGIGCYECGYAGHVEKWTPIEEISSLIALSLLQEAKKEREEKEKNIS